MIENGAEYDETLQRRFSTQKLQQFQIIVIQTYPNFTV